MSVTYLGGQSVAMYFAPVKAQWSRQGPQIPERAEGGSAVAPNKSGAGRGAAANRAVGASLENEPWQSQELVQVELPPGGFVLLKAAAHIIIAASAKGARPNQRIRGVYNLRHCFHRHSELPRERKSMIFPSHGSSSAASPSHAAGTRRRLRLGRPLSSPPLSSADLGGQSTSETFFPETSSVDRLRYKDMTSSYTGTQTGMLIC